MTLGKLQRRLSRIWLIRPDAVVRPATWRVRRSPVPEGRSLTITDAAFAEQPWQSPGRWVAAKGAGAVHYSGGPNDAGFARLLPRCCQSLIMGATDRMKNQQNSVNIMVGQRLETLVQICKA